MRASSDGAVAARRAAVVAFWAATVLFVADVAVVQGWVAPLAAVPADPIVDADPTTGPATATTVTLHGGAEVTFPNAPTDSVQFLEIAGTEVVLRLHSAQTADGATYNMGVVTYPPQVNLSDPATNLLASVSGAAGNIGGRVVRQDVDLYQGAPAVDFLVEASDVQLVARHVLDGRRLYAQNVAFRGGSQPAAADDFFASLDLRGVDTPSSPSPSATPSPSPGASPRPRPDPADTPTPSELPGFTPTPADL